MRVHLRLKKIFDKISKDIYAYVMANIGLNLFKMMIVFLVMFDICAMISVRVNAVLGTVLLFLVSVVMSVISFTRFASIGVTNDEIFILHLKTFKMEEKQIYRVPMDKIRNITVRKLLFGVSLKISFISEEGKLEKKKYNFNIFSIGKPEVKDYANKVYEKLVAIQKIIDKGDF